MGVESKVRIRGDDGPGWGLMTSGGRDVDAISRLSCPRETASWRVTVTTQTV